MSAPAASSVVVRVLGSGGSAGVPVIGCACPACRSSDPRDARLRTSAAIRWRDATGAERVALLDASPDLRQQALRAGLARCDAILFTHIHVDHTFGLDEVRRFNAVMGGPIDIHAEPEVLDYLHRVYEHVFRRDPENPSYVAWLVAHHLEPGRPVDLHGLRFTPIRLLHARMRIVGFRIEALDGDGSVAAVQPGPLPLAWATDVSAIPPKAWRELRGVRTLVLGMLRHRRHPAHFSVDEAVDAAARIGAARTWFVHMTHDIVHAELDPRLPEGMALAYDGLELGAPSPDEAAEADGAARSSR